MTNEATARSGACDAAPNTATRPAARPFAPVVVDAMAPVPWDRFVASTRGGTIFQTRGWSEARRASGWDMRYFSLANRMGGLRACAAVALRRLGPWSIAYCQRGPVWADTDGLERLLEAMRAFARQAGAVFIKMNPDLAEDDAALELFLEAGCRRVPGDAYAHRATYRLDLRAAEEEAILGRMEGRTRRAAARADREGVIVEIGDTRDLLGRFSLLALETAQRRGFPAPNANFLDDVRARIAPEDRFQVALARLGTSDVSAAIHLVHAGRCTYMWGGSSGDQSLKRSGASEALHRDAILDARSKGLSEYDLHGVPLDEEGEPKGGLAFFKRGFGGALVRLVGDLDLPLRPRLYQAWRRYEPFYLRRKGVKT